ncbi:GNAT family N-acetyltransferase [Actinokineospora sp. 24-640]
MTLTARVHDPRTDDEPEGWAEFAARCGLHAVWDYGLMRLEAWMSRNPAMLGVVRDGERIAAAATVLVCHPRWTRRYAPAPRTARPRPGWAEVYLPWLSGYPAVVFDPDLTGEGRRAAVLEFERAVLRHVGPGLLGIAYRPVSGDLLSAVAGRLRRTWRNDPTTVLPNEWPTEDGWLATLSKERRTSIRRYARKIDRDPTLRVREGWGRTDTDPHELATLINRHRARLGTPPMDPRSAVAGVFLAEFLRRPDVRLLTYRDADGTLLAANTLLDHPSSTVLQHWAARSPAEGGRHNLYFDCYLRCVRHLVSAGRDELTSGRGLLDVKASLGFRTRELHTVAVPRPAVGLR